MSEIVTSTMTPNPSTSNGAAAPAPKRKRRSKSKSKAPAQPRLYELTALGRLVVASRRADMSLEEYVDTLRDMLEAYDRLIVE